MDVIFSRYKYLKKKRKEKFIKYGVNYLYVFFRVGIIEFVFYLLRFMI